MSTSLYVGLMSGTSLDAIDAALVEVGDSISLLGTLEHPIPTTTKTDIARISAPGNDEIELMGRLDRTLGALFADATLRLLKKTNTAPTAITAIGSHGQTIRHRPASSGLPPELAFTLQIGDPNTIAKRTGITTVADFRRRDIASGGEGAPLAPAFHAAVFSQPTSNRAIVNIGGIANATVLEGGTLKGGFDTGPGNTLLDLWIQQHKGNNYDRDGSWSAEGTPHQGLLDTLLSDPYFSRTGPRSTGKEQFHLQWLASALDDLGDMEPKDVQATLAELTAKSIALGIASAEVNIDEVYVCGGGALNTDLMRRLYKHLPEAALNTTAALGIDPQWVEAAAFAWLAYRSLSTLSGNAPVVTGASEYEVLGGIYPGGST
ncbi:MAG: anhydro-N-acetylmuramic acid kinase [Halioglobus sp.]